MCVYLHSAALSLLSTKNNICRHMFCFLHEQTVKSRLQNPLTVSLTLAHPTTLFFCIWFFFLVSSLEFLPMNLFTHNSKLNCFFFFYFYFVRIHPTTTTICQTLYRSHFLFFPITDFIFRVEFISKTIYKTIHVNRIDVTIKNGSTFHSAICTLFDTDWLWLWVCKECPLVAFVSRMVSSH